MGFEAGNGIIPEKEVGFPIFSPPFYSPREPVALGYVYSVHGRNKTDASYNGHVIVVMKEGRFSLTKAFPSKGVSRTIACNIIIIIIISIATANIYVLYLYIYTFEYESCD